jgi:hypothetical protein
MANRWAVATGNWSNTATWNGGTLPTAADDVFANGFTVTINQEITVLSIRTEAASGILAGGGFIATADNNINANVLAGTTICLTIGTGVHITVNGNVRGGTVSAASGISLNSGSGTPPCSVAVNGNVTGGSSSAGGCFGITAVNNTSAIIVGNVIGGTIQVSNTAGLQLSGSNVYCHITGDVLANIVTEGILLVGATLEVVGNVFASTTSTGRGINQTSGAGSITITGNVTGGVGAGANGIQTGGAVVVNVFGIAQANQSTGQGILVNSALSTAHVTIARGSTSVINTTAAGIFNNFSGLATYENIEYTELGGVPIGGNCRMRPTGSNYVRILREDGTFYTFSLSSADFPPQTDVRNGVNFDNGNLTGTCHVPQANQVSVGIPVDNTVGTAVLTATDLVNALNAQTTDINNHTTSEVSSIGGGGGGGVTAGDIWNHPINGINTAGSIGERLKNCSTVQTTGDQIASF